MFAINQGEMAYYVGKGRAAIVFFNMIQIANFVFNAALYLNLCSRVLIGLNCQFDLTRWQSNTLPYWQSFTIMALLGLVVWIVTFKYISIKRAKLWAKITCVVFSVLGLLTVALFIYSLATDFKSHQTK